MVIAAEKHYKLHLFIFSLLSIYLFILTPISFLNKFLAIAVCIGVLLHIKDIKFEFRRWYEIVIFIIVNAYLTMAFFGYDLFIVNTLSTERLQRLFVFGSGFIWAGYVLQSIFDVIRTLERIKDRFCSTTNEHYWKKWFVLFVIMVALFMIWQRAYNPIILSPDSWEYFRDSYSVGRSIIYVFINNLIMRIAPTSPEIEWIGIAQILAFSCLLSTILMYFHNKWIRFKWIIVAAIVLPLIPSFGLQTIVVWVDLKVGMMVLWITYAIVRIIDEVILNNTATKKQRLSLCIQICLALVLLYFAKANTTVVYLVTAPSLAVFFVLHKQWRLLSSIALSAILVLFIRFPGHNMLNAGRNLNLDAHKYYAGIHDMQATYYNGGSFSEKNLALLKHYIPNIDDIRGKFRPDWVRRDDWGNLQAVQESMTTREFISMYADTLARNPFHMFRSMLFRSRAYWVLDPKGVVDCVNYTAIYDPSTRSLTTQAPEINVYRRPNILTSTLNRYMAVMNLPIPATIVWRFGIWTALMMISIATLIWRKRFIWLLTYIPVFTHLATIFLTSGWTDYRYGLPVFFVGLFLPATILLQAPAPDAMEVNSQ